MTTLILETLEGSPGLQERGVRHVEEMQLLSTGIGPDRVSDIAANVLKRFLISYTQRQCDIWDLPRKTNVPVGHIYDPDFGGWVDSYEDLPVSPVDGIEKLFSSSRTIIFANYWTFAGATGRLRSGFSDTIAHFGWQFSSSSTLHTHPPTVTVRR